MALKKFLINQLINFLEQPSFHLTSPPTHSIELLKKTLRPGDVLLVEGQQRFSTAIKYLTQSNWSHAALYIGGNELIEADLKEGVIRIPVDTYQGFHTRICRPVNLQPEHLEKIIASLVQKQGLSYDIINIINLLKYLIPVHPFKKLKGSAFISLGSDDPTKVICSSIIAQAYHDVGYPIFPIVRNVEGQRRYAKKHVSTYVPSDFDRSPYFRIVKPSLEHEFDYRKVPWVKEFKDEIKPQPLELNQEVDKLEEA
tara:strand:- start:97456 stop:98220 length:765 start_codon:yes stop_codon:yes gene_type:complete